MESPRRLRMLFPAWIVYWALIGIIKLGPAVGAIWRATRGHEGTGSVSLNYGDGAFKLTVNSLGNQIYSGSVTPIALAFRVAGPPLIVWLAWLFAGRMIERSREKVSS